MNKKIIAILILIIAALAFLSAISFGPLSNIRKKAMINPNSLKPVQQIQQTAPAQNGTTPQDAISNSANKNQMVELNVYKNVDVKENYYQISIPKDWQVAAGDALGNYAVNFPAGSGKVRLMDIPDNTTLELYVLSQEEPRLKKSVPNYKRLNYGKLGVSGNEGYEIVYSGGENQAEQGIIAYIAGQDHAGVIEFNVSTNDFPSFQDMFFKIVNTFNWQNK